MFYLSQISFFSLLLHSFLFLFQSKHYKPNWWRKLDRKLFFLQHKISSSNNEENSLQKVFLLAEKLKKCFIFKL